ncbi:phosphatase PAP2 family protein [Roseomonas stagni]|uniref:Phosphatase PAP2 family protein n=1 Tax=Falsiroseomonas algicola TaxID=2716930 RepID=A0A6M1LEH4_9PROT|nr:phosphatase PAP2 family protein [Falsiroseomonas algicola]NGM18695.1 phosphatase PAP2 family protein [Falsiroseomonas algicola]
MANMGDMGDMGDRGANGLGGGAGLLAFRIDLPFDKEKPQVWRKDKDGAWGWKEDPAIDLEVLPPDLTVTWTPRDWSARWFAWAIMGDFATQTAWKSITLTPYPVAAAEVTAELQLLFRAAQDERPDAMGEIVAQNQDYEDCMAFFMALLRISANSHPRTCGLMHVAGLIGLLTAMHFKNAPGSQPQRPRPSQLHPALLPAIEVPGHPAFPSGHATQAMLMALIVEQALPAERRTKLAPYLHTLAGRIARNREIAGLHYKSDTTGGLELAAKVFELLGSVESYADALKLAQGEWA